MKNVIWGNLICNIFRCIVAYPFFLIVFVISILLSVLGCVVWSIIELVFMCVHFIFTGEISLFKDSIIRDLIKDHSFYNLMLVVLPFTMLIIKKINDFNESLKPIMKNRP